MAFTRARSRQFALLWPICIATTGAVGGRGVLLRMMEQLSVAKGVPKTVMIDAACLRAHRTASSLRVKKGIPAA